MELATHDHCGPCPSLPMQYDNAYDSAMDVAITVNLPELCAQDAVHIGTTPPPRANDVGSTL